MWGVLGIVIGVFAFWFNFTMVPVMMPGYEVVAAPAIFLLSFFSEETDFTPKMVVFIFGQFMGYFCLAFLVRKIKKITLNCRISIF